MNAFNGAARNNAEPMRFRSLGGWVEQPDDLQPALKGHEHADVVVVGAGFAGLSTALELRRVERTSSFWNSSSQASGPAGAMPGICSAAWA